MKKRVRGLRNQERRPDKNPNMIRRPLLTLIVIVAVTVPTVGVAGKVTMKNGTVLDGDVARIESLIDQVPPKDAEAIRVTVTLAGPGLRRSRVRQSFIVSPPG